MGKKKLSMRHEHQSTANLSNGRPKILPICILSGFTKFTLFTFTRTIEKFDKLSSATYTYDQTQPSLSHHTALIFFPLSLASDSKRKTEASCSIL